jgi:hypothetical protein
MLSTMLAFASLAANDTNGHRGLRQGMRLKPERGNEGFLYLFHEPSGHWVGRECQIRVPLARALPEPLAPEQQSVGLELRLFGGKSVESLSPLGGVRNEQRFEIWRWWWLSMPVGDLDLAHPQRLGVQLRWPNQADPTAAEAMEIFVLPPIDESPPEVWSAWRGPDHWRTGSEAWYDEIHSRGPVQKISRRSEYPFEIRCRAGLWEVYARRKK